ncbi:MAG: FAD-binding oxidoreductase [Chloroflexaceae bacterium]|nr:FAD-binding oxidoreductase [Chloroflexaceae bacterium]
MMDPAALATLQAQLTGEVVLPNSDPYDDLRQLSNGRYDRHPALIVCPSNTQDVALAVQFAQAYQLPLALRSGGHSAIGASVNDAGMTLDLRRLNQVEIDLATHTVQVGSGATVGLVSQALQEHGLAVPFGAISSVGVGGITTGGGFGWLMRKYGLTIDNLVAAEIVTADGVIRHVDANTDPDLFWAIRGGGGNFGVVTRFTYQAHAIGTMVYSGPLVITLDNAVAALQALREFAPTIPDELTLWATFAALPPMPPFPPHLHGQAVLLLEGCYVGDLERGAQVLAPLRAAVSAELDLMGPMPYMVRMTMIDGMAHPGFHHEATNTFLHSLPDTAIETLVAQVAAMTTPLIAVQVAPIGAAVARVLPDATAFAHRDAAYLLWLPLAWTPDSSAADAARHTRWMVDTLMAMQPYSTGGAYGNALGGEDADAVQRAYPPTTYARLQTIKQSYDPANVFQGYPPILPA